MTYSKDNLPKVGDVILIGGKRATCSRSDEWGATFTYDAYGTSCFVTAELIGMEYERPRTPLSVAERWTALCEGKMIVTDYATKFEWPEGKPLLFGLGKQADRSHAGTINDPSATWYLVEDA